MERKYKRSKIDLLRRLILRPDAGRTDMAFAGCLMIRRVLLATTCALLLSGAFEGGAVAPAIPGAADAPVVNARGFQPGQPAIPRAPGVRARPATPNKQAAVGANDNIQVNQLAFAANENPLTMAFVRSLYQEILNRQFNEAHHHPALCYYLGSADLQAAPNSAIRRRNISELLKLALVRRAPGVNGIIDPLILRDLTRNDVDDRSASHKIANALTAAGDVLRKIFLENSHANQGRIAVGIRNVNDAIKVVKNAIAGVNIDSQLWGYNIASACRTLALFDQTYNSAMAVFAPLQNADNAAAALPPFSSFHSKQDVLSC